MQVRRPPDTRTFRGLPADSRTWRRVRGHVFRFGEWLIRRGYDCMSWSRGVPPWACAFCGHVPATHEIRVRYRGMGGGKRRKWLPVCGNHNLER